MTRRQVFYSFHYGPDCWRASTVRSIGAIEGNRPTTDNDWETIKKGGDEAVKRWINNQIAGKSCAVILVGNQTANRKWINYEIVRAWNEGLGVVGIHIHGLKDHAGYISTKGANPFDYITHGNSGNKLSSVAKCYDPAGLDSRARYDWISKYISTAVEEAIEIRGRN